MKAMRSCTVWFTVLLSFGRSRGTTDVGDTSPPDDVLHVRLHNVSHGQLTHDDAQHTVEVGLLHHNSTHSVLHLNSSTAGLHRDVLVSSDVAEGLQLADPVNASDGHGAWSGHEELVATPGGWVSSPLNASVAVEDRTAEMDAADEGHQSRVQVFAAVMGACVGVVLLAGVGVWVLRGRRRGDPALLGEEDEEFTVFSVVDHPYSGKKGDNYSPLR